jgi:hypothetical protein
LAAVAITLTVFATAAWLLLWSANRPHRTSHTSPADLRPSYRIVRIIPPPDTRPGERVTMGEWIKAVADEDKARREREGLPP